MIKFLLSLFTGYKTDGSPNPTLDKNVFSYTDAYTRMMKTGEFGLDMYPFTFQESRPLFVQSKRYLKWDRIEKIKDEYVGLGVLKNEKNEILLALQYSTYIQKIPNTSYFIVYRRKSSILHFTILNMEELTPIADPEESLLEFGKDNERLTPWFNASSEEWEVSLEEEQLIINCDFPEILKKMDEIIVVKDLKWITDGPGTAILSLQPKKGRIQVYPQDWFNKDNTYDHMYQWITIAQRNPHSECIEGSGIRLGNFILKESGRELIKGGKTVFF